MPLTLHVHADNYVVAAISAASCLSTARSTSTSGQCLAWNALPLLSFCQSCPIYHILSPIVTAADDGGRLAHPRLLPP
jgi:hypothetical protein